MKLIFTKEMKEIKDQRKKKELDRHQSHVGEAIVLGQMIFMDHRGCHLVDNKVLYHDDHLKKENGKL